MCSLHRDDRTLSDRSRAASAPEHGLAHSRHRRTAVPQQSPRPRTARCVQPGSRVAQLRFSRAHVPRPRSRRPSARRDRGFSPSLLKTFACSPRSWSCATLTASGAGSGVVQRAGSVDSRPRTAQSSWSSPSGVRRKHSPRRPVRCSHSTTRAGAGVVATHQSRRSPDRGSRSTRQIRDVERQQQIGGGSTPESPEQFSGWQSERPRVVVVAARRASNSASSTSRSSPRVERHASRDNDDLLRRHQQVDPARSTSCAGALNAVRPTRGCRQVRAPSPRLASCSSMPVTTPAPAGRLPEADRAPASAAPSAHRSCPTSRSRGPASLCRCRMQPSRSRDVRGVNRPPPPTTERSAIAPRFTPPSSLHQPNEVKHGCTPTSPVALL